MLALESATIGVGAAVVDDDGVRASETIRAGRLQTETLHPLIAEVLHESKTTVGELDLIGVDIGPGLFTGLRVGVTTAKTLSFALGIPALGCTSTEALIAQCAGAGHRSLAVIDMRRSEVAFALDDDPTDIVLCSPAACAAFLAEDSSIAGAHVAGDGMSRYREVFEPVIALRGLVVDENVHQFVDAGVLGSHLLDQVRVRPELMNSEVSPLYLRDADTKIGWSARDLSKVDKG